MPLPSKPYLYYNYFKRYKVCPLCQATNNNNTEQGFYCFFMPQQISPEACTWKDYKVCPLLKNSGKCTLVDDLIQELKK